jgi:metallo-beta-lactamase class B
MTGIRFWAGRITIGMALLALGSLATTATAATSTKDCPQCAEWNQPHKPFQIYGNTWYVGTQGLSAILITSDFGHVLIDGGLAESAPLIRANIETLGFKVTDVKAILNSHAHYDHAGGIALLQQWSGAQVYALRPAQTVLLTGKLDKADPQFGVKAPAIAPVPAVWVVQDDQLLGVGNVRLRVTATPGHTPGGASWGWESCAGGKCLNFFYADSLTAVSADKYRFKDHPDVLRDFESSLKRVEPAACDVLLTPHPDRSHLFERLDPASGSRSADIKDAKACEGYAKSAREALAKRLADEG